MLDQPLLIENPEYSLSLVYVFSFANLAPKPSSRPWYDVPISLSSDTLEDLSDHVAYSASDMKVMKLSFPLTIVPLEA